MAVTNRDRIDKTLHLLRDALRDFVARELQTYWGENWRSQVRHVLSDTRLQGLGDDQTDDVAALLVIIDRTYKDVFSETLSKADRSMVNELLSVRNDWAHQKQFSSDDTYRALDTASRLLTSITASQQLEAVEKMKTELLRVRFDEQARAERRKTSSTGESESAEAIGLRPWREVVSPHADVRSGRYRQAEFAADLWQVHLGEGSVEYRDPREFFRRTFLTESLGKLLQNAVRRLSGNAGDPVIQLQTNFGGGKTHSMLALYHLLSGAQPGDLAGVEDLLRAINADRIPSARRVVLVGHRLKPAEPDRKSDGTLVHTLWGEIAWQLGGRDAYERVRVSDEKGISPGDTLRELFNEYGPCLVLIDEWVAYARMLHDRSDLPAGTFDTQFTFAQTLSESAKAARHTLLVVSLPASDVGSGGPAMGDVLEVGGERGRTALDRLRNAIGRVETSWRPASGEESFEIVRRRLFEPLTERDQFAARDNTARALREWYQSQAQEFPPECRNAEYEERIRASYPIHPEVFDRLYTDWSTLPKFQRTRGVLRLMAVVINALWESEHPAPIILPSAIPLDDLRVQGELSHFLSDNWVPIIEKDVDGLNSLPVRTDKEILNLGRLSACRRVARTVFLGSAPLSEAANRGLEDRRIKLGCALPQQSPQVFGDALRRLAASATYLYQDGIRYWYATQPTVTKLAGDRAEQLLSRPDLVQAEIKRRIDADRRQIADFARVHPLITASADVVDEPEVRLVILGTDFPHSRNASDEATNLARVILETRGNASRLYRNALVFVAADKARLQDFEDAVRRFLAWQSICDEAEGLELTPHQKRQTVQQREAADHTVTTRLGETFQWLIVPQQEKPESPVEFGEYRLNGSDPIAVRAAQKLKAEDLLIPRYACTNLAQLLDKIPLWRGNHVEIRQLVEDFARYVYLPRFRTPSILVDSIREGIALLTWHNETFAYADAFDESKGRYIGLRVKELIPLTAEGASGMIVRREIAHHQLAETVAPPPDPVQGTGTAEPIQVPGSGVQPPPTGPSPSLPKKQPVRFYGTVDLHPQRVGRDAARVADEVISHLNGIVGSQVTVSIEISAEIPAGVPEHIVRIVTENCRTLRFENQGFEEE